MGLLRSRVMKQLKVTAAVFIEGGKVFCAQRKNEGELALHWEFPGGKVEEGESGEVTIVREIEEELSAKIEVIRYLMEVEHTYQTFSISLLAYLCRVVEGELILREHLAKRWLSLEELYSVNWATADLPIVALVEKILRGEDGDT